MAEGVADGGFVRPAVLVGVGCVVGRPERRGVGVTEGVGVVAGTTAGALGEGVLTTWDGCRLPPPATGMSGADGLGSNRPTPGIDSGSRPGEDAMLTANKAR